MEIKEIIKDRRIALGLTMRQVANRVGVAESTYSRWESGAISNMTRDKIKLLADVLHLDPNVLIGGVNESVLSDNEGNRIELVQDELFEKRKLLFDLSNKASAEDLDKFITILEAIIK